MQSVWVAKSCRPFLSRQTAPLSCWQKHSYATKVHEPLRILFCGSDAFSIASLRALYNHYAATRPENVASLDVVCRPGKRVGRGLKNVREVPIKSAAKELGLPVHEIDTFTGWQPPNPGGAPINLVIAVSFGLLVPPRILNNAKYGGLNVHPSLLPDLRGPAPLHHTLLQRRKITGVTIQTLHPKHFDQGAILAQTPFPGISIPHPESCTPNDLLQCLAPIGGDMLVETLKRRSFVPPLDLIPPFTALSDTDILCHASKITAEDRHIDWHTWTAEDIMLRQRVLGTTWDDVTYQRCSSALFPGESKRINYHGWRSLNAHTSVEEISHSKNLEHRNPFPSKDHGRASSPLRGYSPGTLCWVHEPNNERRLGIVTCNGKVVCPESATIEGRPQRDGVTELMKIAIKNEHRLITE